MRSSKLFKNSSSTKRPILATKQSSSTNKILKNQESNDKKLKLKNTDHLNRQPKPLASLSKDKQIVSIHKKRSENEDWNEKTKTQTSGKIDKISHSDEQSTKANGLFESVELYQKFLKNIKAPSSISRPQGKTDAQTLKESLKSRIEEFKTLQKVHDQEIKQLKNRLSAEQTRRLQKIQSIQKLTFHNQILSIEKTLKPNHSLKYSHQFSIQQK